MKMKNIVKWLAAPAVLGLLSLASAQADTYLGNDGGIYTAKYTSPSSAYLLGTVIPGLQGNGGQVARDVLMTNNLIAMATLGSQSGTGTSADPLYSRSFNSFGSLPAATDTGNVNAPSGTYPDGFIGPVTIDLSHTGMFTYLVVAYDGPNSGAAVWNIAGLTGILSFNAYALPELIAGNLTGNLLGSNLPSMYKITSWTLLNPTSAPDGGATVMLLGAALGALGMVRRFIMS